MKTFNNTSITNITKRILIIISLITIIFFINSCSKSGKENPIGLWDDIIQLSVKQVYFEPTSDSVIIKTKGDSWWVVGISINNENFYDFKEIDITSDKYTIEQGGILVEKKDKNTLYIQADENPLNTERRIIIELEAGDYFDSVIITQGVMKTN